MCEVVAVVGKFLPENAQAGAGGRAGRDWGRKEGDGRPLRCVLLNGSIVWHREDTHGLVMSSSALSTG